MTEDIALKYISAGLDAIYVGIDAFTEETYNKIRCGGDFREVTRNVLKYQNLLEKIGKNSQKIFVQFVVDDWNKHEVDEFAQFWNKKGVIVKIRPKVSWAGLVKAKNLEKKKKRKPCYWLMKTINICSNGDVALCSVDIHCRVKCGNIIEQSISEVWNNRLLRLRELQMVNEYDQFPEMCRNCNDWQSSGYSDYIEI